MQARKKAAVERSAAFFLV